jgi:hypothetical protein
VSALHGFTAKPRLSKYEKAAMRWLERYSRKARRGSVTSQRSRVISRRGRVRRGSSPGLDQSGRAYNADSVVAVAPVSPTNSHDLAPLTGHRQSASRKYGANAPVTTESRGMFTVATRATCPPAHSAASDSGHAGAFGQSSAGGSPNRVASAGTGSLGTGVTGGWSLGSDSNAGAPRTRRRRGRSPAKPRKSER